MNAGDLTRRATLLEPQAGTGGADADGKVFQSEEGQGTIWCHLLPLKGGEAVMQARLQSRSPAILTVRATSLTRQITSEWSAEIDGRKYEFKEDPRLTQDRGFLEALVEAR